MQKVALGLGLCLFVALVTLRAAAAETCTTMSGAGQAPGTQFYVFKVSGYYQIWHDNNGTPGIQPEAWGTQSPDSNWGSTEILGVCVGSGSSIVCV